MPWRLMALAIPILCFPGCGCKGEPVILHSGMSYEEARSTLQNFGAEEGGPDFSGMIREGANSWWVLPDRTVIWLSEQKPSRIEILVGPQGKGYENKFKWSEGSQVIEQLDLNEHVKGR